MTKGRAVDIAHSLKRCSGCLHVELFGNRRGT